MSSSKLHHRPGRQPKRAKDHKDAGAKAEPSKEAAKSSAKLGATTTLPKKQQQQKKHSIMGIFLLSLTLATTGVLLMTGLDKFYRTGRKPKAMSVPKDCWKIADIHGPEDIEISTEHNLAFISSDNRSWRASSWYFHRPSTKTETNGGIFSLPLWNNRKSKSKEVKLVDYPLDDFHPAGMSIFSQSDPNTHKKIHRLFVINHSHKGDRVELFNYEAKDNTLVYVRSIESSDFTAPKGIVAVDLDRFYLTNQNAMSTKYGKFVEDAASLALGSIVYYNGQETRKVLRYLKNPSGIARSADNKQLYVASFSDRAVHIYNRTEDVLTGELEKDDDVWVGNHVEHLTIDDVTGDIYVASHPSYSAYLRHRLGYLPQAPSHIVKLERLVPDHFLHPDEPVGLPNIAQDPRVVKWEVRDLYYSAGDDISASSVAAVHNQQLILGSSTGHHLLQCSLHLHRVEVQEGEHEREQGDA
ncbi:Serum paraoxonase/lactonase 3 [Actinomortierella ambigua]|nr:Serum paraoxonase/lactonase 3 [Actinomortierella ambigua]